MWESIKIQIFIYVQNTRMSECELSSQDSNLEKNENERERVNEKCGDER
jgi:hypothetical protein